MGDSESAKYAWIITSRCRDGNTKLFGEMHVYSCGDEEMGNEEILCDRVEKENPNPDSFILQERTRSGKQCTGKVGNYLRNEFFSYRNLSK